METIKICHREFQILERKENDNLILERKNKKFFARKFDYKTQEGKEMSYAMKKIATSGVKVPKLYCIDKKVGYIVSEYLEGETMLNYLSLKDMSESLCEQLFKNAYYARISGMTLNYEPDKWMLVGETLYYTYPFFIVYKKEKDLVERYIRLWFNTKELADYISNMGVYYDKSRVKSEYSVNKEIVLATCKFYR